MKATMIDTGHFDESRYPIPPARVEPSATECVHTPCPEGYHARYEWAERAMKSHRQVRCPHCGRWAIWLPKKEAAEINKRDSAEARRIAKAYEKRHREQVAKEYPPLPRYPKKRKRG